MGLSPLARGNPKADCTLGLAAGPIPARAGQPGDRAQIEPVRGAYPRSRGATAGRPRCLLPLRGLSPLARGNLLQHSQCARAAGPIPARAGQPGSQPPGQRPIGAYPRSRGATAYCGTLSSVCRGLSPLARGNLRARLRRLWFCGPIPARAGQPS